MYRSSKPSPFRPTHTSGLTGNSPRGPLRHRCGLCLKTKPQLSRCTACRVVRYCSREHQAEHWQEHKSLCKLVKSRRSKADEGSQLELVAILRNSGTLDGVTEALDQMQDLLRRHPGRSNTLSHIPASMLLLDQDQECYDFIRWWTINRLSMDYHPDDPEWTLPAIPIGADVLEDVDYLQQQDDRNFFLVATALLFKMKLLVDIINIIRVRLVATSTEYCIPPEIWKQVELQIIRSPLSRQWVIRSDAWVDMVLRKLRIQVTHLIRSVHRINSLFTCSLLAPSDLLAYPETSFLDVPTEHMQMYLRLGYFAWWQHVGVLELLQSTNSITFQWAKYNVMDMVEERLKDHHFCARRVYKSKEALMPALSGRAMSLYFDLAVQDAMSLSKALPSETRWFWTSKNLPLWSVQSTGALSYYPAP